MVFTNNLYAQDDSLALPYPSMLFSPVDNITNTYEYDLDSKEFILKRKAGSLLLNRPKFMSEQSYREWVFNNNIQDYWRQKVQSKLFEEGVAGTKPKLKIGGEAFNKIFGGNTVDIRPQGAAELTFSGNFDKVENPSLTENQQNNASFNFDQSIQMNVIGKIGTKLTLRTNYDTKSQFDFENQTKIEYTGDEDDIIKKIELGNVSLPLSGSLISGTQSLFGVKAQFQFGRATFTAVFSEQKSETSTISVEGGAQVSNFEIYADDYEENKHFFLGQYFYDQYDYSLSNMPIINSGIQITNLEVWVTNKSGSTQNIRNILAFQDLGETLDKVHNQSLGESSEPIGVITPDNRNNQLYPVDLVASNSGIRQVSNVTSLLNSIGFEQAVDYEKVENAKKLTSSEYSFNSQLGFISLNQALNSDEVLAVAFQYTINGSPYQVGELAADVAAPDVLILKLLKSTTVNINLPMWNLLMKNVYALGAYQVNKEDFELQIMYQDDESGVPLPYIPEEGMSGELLIKTLNLDNLNNNNDPGSNGVFDYVENLTIKSSNGRVYLPSTKPFGQYLRSKFIEAGLSDEIADKYVYDALYDSTQTAASQVAELNKFILKGQYKSSSGSDISLNAMSIPQGSVSVTMGGATLEENIHYTVDYNLGRVKIIDEGILSSGQKIDIKLENESGYSWKTKRYLGLQADYQVNDDFVLGATVLNLSESTTTPKINMGDEPISNTIWGLSGAYKKKSQLITTLLDKLPLIETKEQSQVSMSAEFAQFIPGHPKSINVDATGTAYIDDFENSQSPIDLRTAQAWSLASTPQDLDLFPESVLNDDLRYGYNRALLSWYIINSDLQRETAYSPSHLTDEDREAPYVREITINEIFPDKDIPHGQPLRLRTFDLAFYPSERGPYNYDVEGSEFSNGLDEDGKLLAPETRWGGIVRKIDNNDFETANIEFLEFWMMDPFLENSESAGGDFYINLGSISEDILKDSRKSYENGLPIDDDESNVDTTAWGRVPSVQALVRAFNSGEAARLKQDVGLDGLDDVQEREFISIQGGETNSYLERIAQSLGESSSAYTKAYSDPSADNYHYYYGSDYDSQEKGILERYKYYTRTDGNSPMSNQSQSSYTQLPDVEDINSDYTLSEVESYYQYKISMRPQDLMEVGQNYITSIIENAGANHDARWIQFKVPVKSYDKKVGSIPDFKSIRFMRMFLNGFDDDVVLRFATLDMVRGEWRKYLNSLVEPGQPQEDNGTSFDISVVNLEENGRRDPIPYVLPPGIERERIQGSTTQQAQNEQSMSYVVCDLEDGDARGAFKNVTMDMRAYNKIKFFVHAENRETSPNSSALNDGDLTMFIRVGTDYNSNYYEYEIPLEVTDWGASARSDVWPESNEVEIDFDVLKEAKQARNVAMRQGQASYTSKYIYSPSNSSANITIMGNPNLGNVRTIMLGVRNPEQDDEFDLEDDGLPKCAEIWINELRLTDFDERGGWAAKTQLRTNLADIGDFTVVGNMSTVGFGSLEQGVTERNTEETKSYNFTSNIELGKLLPEKANIKMPLFFNVSETVLTPQYNPLDPDIELEATLADETISAGARDSLRKIVENYTQRKSFNLNNVRKERGGARSGKSSGKAKQSKGSRSSKANKNKLYDIENLSLSYSYSELFNRNIDTEFSVQKDYRGGVAYNFTNSPKNYKPFSKIKFLKRSKYLRLVKDFNFYLLPKSLTARVDFDRSYSETKMRNMASLNTSVPVNIVEPDTMFSKMFNLQQNYAVKYDLTRSLKLNFKSQTVSVVDEPEGKIDTEAEKIALRDSILNFGRTTDYHHDFDLRYTVPINKFPLTDWLSLNVNYSGSYDWDASSRAFSSDTINLGNTIQNSNKKRVNAKLNMFTLYSKVPYFKSVVRGSSSKKGSGRKPSVNKRGAKITTEEKTTAQKDDEEQSEEEEEEEKNPFAFMEHVTRAVLSLKDVNISYDETNNTSLPGFITSSIGAFGMEDAFGSDPAPGWGFVFGEQPDIDDLQAFAGKGWITTDTLLNQQYSHRTGAKLTLRANVEPVKRLRFRLTASRSKEKTEYFTFRNTGTLEEIEFERLNETESGNFYMSYLTVNTAFRPMEINSSTTFDELRANRLVIAQRLAAEKGITATDESGYPIGYGPNSQEVLIPSFLAAYAGVDAKTQTLNKFPTIPLPNWDVQYDGLTDVDWIKKYFKTVSLSHGYSSKYTIGNYQSNLFYEEQDGPYTGNPLDNPEDFDMNGDLLSEFQISMVTISESFSPLLKVDLAMHNNFTARIEYKKSRNIALSLSNNQVEESSNNSISFGLGYQIDDFEIRLSSANGNRTFSSNLDLNVDVTIDNKKSALRMLEENTHTPVSGTKNVSIKTSADYVLSERVNMQLFYDRMVTSYEVSNNYNSVNSKFGLKLRFTFGS